MVIKHVESEKSRDLIKENAKYWMEHVEKNIKPRVSMKASVGKIEAELGSKVENESDST